VGDGINDPGVDQVGTDYIEDGGRDPVTRETGERRLTKE
jgi:hypothetical protein